MTRKDYEAMARVLKSVLDNANDAHPLDEVEARDVVAEVAEGFARIARADNPRFDVARFRAAVGL